MSISGARWQWRRRLIRGASGSSHPATGVTRTLADGPYGFHPESARVDAEVVAAVEANDLMRLIDLDEGRARDAAIDGLWQALMLAGALETGR